MKTLHSVIIGTNTKSYVLDNKQIYCTYVVKRTILRKRLRRAIQTGRTRVPGIKATPTNFGLISPPASARTSSSDGSETRRVGRETAHERTTNNKTAYVGHIIRSLLTFVDDVVRDGQAHVFELVHQTRTVHGRRSSSREHRHKHAGGDCADRRRARERRTVVLAIPTSEPAKTSGKPTDRVAASSGWQMYRCGRSRTHSRSDWCPANPVRSCCVVLWGVCVLRRRRRSSLCDGRATAGKTAA